ncbi:MAG: hypothetical protein M1821_004304 [Bathelium mastoideum]|nr:MAG: hypothetical protein M1821_004304 [Bathelium mastoideum]
MASGTIQPNRIDESTPTPGPSAYDVSPFTGERTPLSEEPFSSLDAWEQRNILSLDGGGIRGIWTLMALEKLMDYIAEEENKVVDDTEPAEHSFAPRPFPQYVSHGPFNGREEERQHETWMNSRKYLPCHYFDIIGGSSTGALIAIMLGRFRMPVSDCLHEYEALAGQIFGKPRHFPILTTLMTNQTIRSKYSYKTMEKIFKDVAKRREERFTDGADHHAQSFRSAKGLCGTFVTSMRSVPSKAANASSKPVIIRSYDNVKRNRTSRSQVESARPSRRSTGGITRSETMRPGRQGHSQRVNSLTIAGESHRWQVWEVARAATAADFFFDPFEIEVQDSPEKVAFTDGGLDQNNNPVREAVEEVEDLFGPDALGAVVSVGTARGSKPSKHKLIAKIKAMIAEKTNPEVNHGWAETRFAALPENYFRLNDPGALDIELDDWRPRKHWYRRSDRAPGSRTFEEIERKFNEWVAQPACAGRFRACAVELVRRRRARTKKDAEWEYFATGIKFRCYAGRCNETFRNRDHFKAHLESKHPTEMNLSWDEIERRMKQKGWTSMWCYQKPR